MTKPTPPYWFKRQRYGWGWMPVTWQAWLSLLGYLCVMAVNVFILVNAEGGDLGTQIGLFCLVILTSTTTLGWITYNHAPKPSWRWGKKPSDTPEDDF
jgi:cytochrome b